MQLSDLRQRHLANEYAITNNCSVALIMQLSKMLAGVADLKPRKDAEVLLHVCSQHLLNHCSPQGLVVCFGQLLHTGIIS